MEINSDFLLGEFKREIPEMRWDSILDLGHWNRYTISIHIYILFGWLNQERVYINSSAVDNVTTHKDMKDEKIVYSDPFDEYT